MVKLERPCRQWRCWRFLLTILTLGLMRLRPQQMPQLPWLISLKQMLLETPHSQMYTTLLDKDGKVVGTNDPDRAIDRRYKSVEQGGEGAGLSKGRQRDGSFSDGCRDAGQR